jgi:23S rRNA (adenine2030-N6)-methyltransferase
MIALQLLRRHDRAWLYELHPEDARLLEERFSHDRRVQIVRQDGYAALPGLLPPVSRRGLVLMDPSYEIKSDYQQVVAAITQAYQKFATGTYALWYPVVERQRITELETGLVRSGVRDIQRFELSVRPDSLEPGMTGCGMVVVNPPWTLMASMQMLLPRLVQTLGQHPDAAYKADVLVAE